MRFIGLYSGCGGLDFGTANAGFDPVLQVDNNPWCHETLLQAKLKYHHRGSVERWDMDRLVSLGALKQYRSRENRIDLVVGGPPCQGFSVAGKMDPGDPRSRQAFTFLDAVRHVNPRAFIMENVAGLAASRWSLVMGRLRTRAERSGYSTSVHVLNAREWGVPQNRTRLFLIGIKGDNPVDYITPGPFVMGEGVSAGAALRGIRRPVKDDYEPASKITLARKPVLRSSAFAGMLLNGGGRVMDLRQPAPTLTATMGGNRTPIVDLDQLEHNVSPWIQGYHNSLYNYKQPPRTDIPEHVRMRRISVREALVLQGFPVDYPLQGPPTARFSQAGNAVPPPLAEAVSRAVRSRLER